MGFQTSYKIHLGRFNNMRNPDGYIKLGKNFLQDILQSAADWLGAKLH